MSGPEPSRRELRIGDREREAAVDALGEHYAAGRLTREEYDERADAAWQARTGSALAPLFADLPSLVPAGPPAAQVLPVQQPSAGQAYRRIGARMVPLLVLALVLSAVVHAPVFLLLVLWLLWSRSNRGPGPHAGQHTGQHTGQHNGWSGRFR
jgi:hypothetical protein